jgi:hypothetical protein
MKGFAVRGVREVTVEHSGCVEHDLDSLLPIAAHRGTEPESQVRQLGCGRVEGHAIADRSLCELLGLFVVPEAGFV